MGPDRTTVGGKRTTRWPVARPPQGGERSILWKLRTGAPWRDLPERYGPWQTCYDRFSRWRRDGTWDRLLADAQTKSDAAGEVEWLVSVDSTIARQPAFDLDLDHDTVLALDA
jgi:transposase